MNLFMMCVKPDPRAMRAAPAPFTIRECRADETALWTRICSESEEDAVCAQEYIDEVYAPKDPHFYRRIRLVCGGDGEPVGACMLWRAYGCMESVHWLRVLPGYEGLGLGRAVLSACLETADGPVILHTQERNISAIALYHSFGFRFLSDPKIGLRKNDLAKAAPLLREALPADIFGGMLCAPEEFLRAAEGVRSEF